MKWLSILFLNLFVSVALATSTNNFTGQQVKTGDQTSNVITGGGGGGTSATDNFTRTDADPISSPGSDGTMTWSTSVGSYPGNLRIVSNKATGHAGFGSLVASKIATPVFGPNQSMIVVLDAGLDMGAGVRMQSSSGAGYKLVPFNATTLAMYRVDDSGVIDPHLLPNFWTVPTMGAGDVIKITANGSTLTAFLNGVSIGSNTDATYSTGQPFIVCNNAATITSVTASSP